MVPSNKWSFYGITSYLDCYIKETLHLTDSDLFCSAEKYRSDSLTRPLDKRAEKSSRRAPMGLLNPGSES
jgi:hypothetical protein